VKLTEEYDARLLSARVNAATGWPVETWVIHETGDPGASIAQVDLFRDNSEWLVWDACIIRESVRNLARRIAASKNK
jgi:hypothetical protein